MSSGDSSLHFFPHMQRCNSYNQHFAAMAPVSPSPSPSSSSSDLYELSAVIRRVCSTGDLQGAHAGFPGSGDAYSQDIGGGGGGTARVGRYSPEQRKERIEKYRSKRTQRNFQKKITYACRKTLADSRPRVKGRFTRNGEPDAENNEAVGYFSHDSFNQGETGDVAASSIDEIEWWHAMQSTLYCQGSSGLYDPDLLAALFCTPAATDATFS